MIHELDLETISMETLPLGCVSKIIENDLDSDIFGLCSSLMAMARTGRKDALTLLFGIAWRNRDNYSRMTSFISAVRNYGHPEIIDFFASELIRVPSSPSSRTYLRSLLKELIRARTKQSSELLSELQNDKRIGAKYRNAIKKYLNEDDTYES